LGLFAHSRKKVKLINIVFTIFFLH